MAAPIVVDNLIEEIRDKMDENNTQPISDARILRALNRAARNFYHLVSKQYNQVYLTSVTATTDGTANIQIPEDAYARRIAFVTLIVNSVETKLKATTPAIVHQRNVTTTSTYPRKYAVMGENIVLYPIPSTGVTIKLYYMRKPGTLVTQQGRIIAIGADNVTVDTLGSDLATTVNDLKAFVSIIDPETGLSKVNLQVSSLDATNNIITFKTSSLNRSSVYGRDISSSLPATLAIDDYICSIEGTCVLELLSDYSDYLTQYAVVELKRGLGLVLDSDFANLKDLEKQVTSIWSGRENNTQISNNNELFK